MHILDPSWIFETKTQSFCEKIEHCLRKFHIHPTIFGTKMKKEFTEENNTIISFSWFTRVSYRARGQFMNRSKANKKRSISPFQWWDRMKEEVLTIKSRKFLE